MAGLWIAFLAAVIVLKVLGVVKLSWLTIVILWFAPGVLIAVVYALILGAMFLYAHSVGRLD